MVGQNLDTPYGSINIYLQSRDAQVSLGSANKIWYLETPIIPPRPNVRMLCAVTDFQCAYSWYLIRTGVNDTFMFDMDNGGGVVTYTCVVAEGNYNVTTFLDAMTNVSFPAAGVPASTIMGYFEVTNTIEIKDVTAVSIVVRSKANGTTLDTEMGIDLVTNSVGVQFVMMPNMVDFAGIPNIYIMAPTLGLNNRDGRGEVNLCLGKVPVGTQPMGFVYLPKSQFVYLTLDDREIKKVQLILEDDEQNILDLHGITWSITLSIHYQYQRFADAKESLTIETGLNQEELIHRKQTKRDKDVATTHTMEDGTVMEGSSHDEYVKNRNDKTD